MILTKCRIYAANVHRPSRVSYVLAVNLNSGYIAPWSDRSTLYRQIVTLRKTMYSMFISIYGTIRYHLPWPYSVRNCFLNSLPRSLKKKFALKSFLFLWKPATRANFQVLFPLSSIQLQFSEFILSTVAPSLTNLYQIGVIKYSKVLEDRVVIYI